MVGAGSSYYMLSGLAAGSYALSLTGVAGDVSLQILSNADFTSGSLCSSANVGVSASESCSFTVPASGTVYILVTAVSGTTGAVFTIAQGAVAPPSESEPNGTIATADGPISGDATLTGGLTTSDYDYYAVSNTGATAASVIFQTFTGSVGACSYDTVIDLYTSTGASLASDDDSGIGACSTFTYSIPAGTTYYLRVRAFGGSAIPGYLLVLNFP
jgi:hypothetical protein